MHLLPWEGSPSMLKQRSSVVWDLVPSPEQLSLPGQVALSENSVGHPHR